MSLEDTAQSEMIQIDQRLRLRAFDGSYDFALPWFADADTVYHICRVRTSCTAEDVKELFVYYQGVCEQYIIELLENEDYRPIGWAAFNEWDMPMVIAPAYRNQKIGRRVIQCLIERGRILGYDELMLRSIYDDNPAALRCYMAAGFRIYAITADSSLLSALL